MIARTWRGKVPLSNAEAFYKHLLTTGVADYLRQAGCLQVHLWRRDSNAWSQFVLSSIWSSMESICRYTGGSPERAVLYTGDEAFGLVPDLEVMHFDVLYASQMAANVDRKEKEGL